MLKSIAKAGSECISKYENNASYNTDEIAPDLIGFWKNWIVLYWLKIGC